MRHTRVYLRICFHFIFHFLSAAKPRQGFCEKAFTLACRCCDIIALASRKLAAPGRNCKSQLVGFVVCDVLGIPVAPGRKFTSQLVGVVTYDSLETTQSRTICPCTYGLVSA